MEDSILDDPSQVTGIIYLIEHIDSGKKYVGQTLSHRKNRGRYRPFGAEGRFRDHISEAINNTKRKQCTYLNNAIRLYGADAFKITVIEECEKAELDGLECAYIAEYASLFPTGYNLTKGGKGARATATIENHTALNTPRKRGGCKFRSPETRQKMSARAQEIGVTVEDRARCMKNALALHARKRLQRFKDVTVDISKMDDYITIRAGVVTVKIGTLTTELRSKFESEEAQIKKAKEFIESLLQATLPNCSGNP